jgi:ATP-binding cassette subfamily F protein uup
MDNVVTSIMVFEEEGHIQEYVGGFSDWRAKGGSLLPVETNESNRGAGDQKGVSVAKGASVVQTMPRKLSYKEQRELDALPERIEELELQQTQLNARISDAGFYDNDNTTIQDTLQRMTNLQAQLQACYRRWETLDVD